MQGLPTTASKSTPNKYLIETNPALTDLHQFLNSDYLLAKLGYDPDDSAKRLGDGLYEQRLVQQAITARTGQALLDGMASNEAQFKYLMDNAIASKQALNLSVGVALTSEQVAALTHDIVWMQDQVVNGEHVLVPVLYLANANDRLAPSGALVQGRDVTLIAGENLSNSGTLKASDNLTVQAVNDLANSRLMQAGQRLDLTAGGSVSNRAGGILKGRDVSVTTLIGDISNERSIASTEASGQGFSQRTSVVDNAARIEASNDLTLTAGHDINNVGGALQAGGKATLTAANDVVIAAAEETNSSSRQDKRHSFSQSTTTQHASEVSAGTDLSVTAGNDLSVVASHLKAGGNVGLEAGKDVTIESAANEDRSYYKGRRSSAEDDHLRQVAATVDAKGNVTVAAGQDMGIVASQLTAGQNLKLDASRDLVIGSAQDEDFSARAKKHKGSFGRSSSRESQSYASTNVGSVLEAGNDLTINASQGSDGSVSLDGGRNLAVVGSSLSAGNDLLVGATGDVLIASGQSESGSSSRKSKSGTLGLNKSGKSQEQRQLTQVASDLSAGNDAIVMAGRNVQMAASQMIADHDAQLSAGVVDATGDVQLTTAQNEAYFYSNAWKKKTGLFVGGGASLTGSGGEKGFSVTFNQKNKQGQQSQENTAVGSLVSAGNNATLEAARDVSLRGSQVEALNTLGLKAGRDVNINAASNTGNASQWSSKSAGGFSLGGDRNGFTLFIGSEEAARAT